MRLSQLGRQPSRLGQRAKPRKEKHITNIGAPEGEQLR